MGREPQDREGPVTRRLPQGAEPLALARELETPQVQEAAVLEPATDEATPAAGPAVQGISRHRGVVQVLAADLVRVRSPV